MVDRVYITPYNEPLTDCQSANGSCTVQSGQPNVITPRTLTAAADLHSLYWTIRRFTDPSTFQHSAPDRPESTCSVAATTTWNGLPHDVIRRPKCWQRDFL